MTSHLTITLLRLVALEYIEQFNELDANCEYLGPSSMCFLRLIIRQTPGVSMQEIE